MQGLHSAMNSLLLEVGVGLVGVPLILRGDPITSLGLAR